MTPENWADYDVIFIGYPIWWQEAAWPINDFVEENDFSGKTVIPFATSTSSDLGEKWKFTRRGGRNRQLGRRTTVYFISYKLRSS